MFPPVSLGSFDCLLPYYPILLIFENWTTANLQRFSQSPVSRDFNIGIPQNHSRTPLRFPFLSGSQLDIRYTPQNPMKSLLTKWNICSIIASTLFIGSSECRCSLCLIKYYSFRLVFSRNEYHVSEKADRKEFCNEYRHALVRQRPKGDPGRQDRPRRTLLS
jgi:hypothetical protein